MRVFNILKYTPTYATALDLSPVDFWLRFNRAWVRLFVAFENAGALCTSPVVSLCADAGVQPLLHRRLVLVVKLLTSIAQNPHHPTFTHLFNPLYLTSQQRSSRHLRHHFKYQLKPKFSYRSPTISASPPPWLLNSSFSILELTEFSKKCFSQVYKLYP